MITLKKIKNKSIYDIFNFISYKIDNFLIYPKKGFTRNHVDNFMYKNFINIKSNLKVLDVGAGNKPYQKYFNNCKYDTCESSEVLNQIGFKGNMDHTFYCDITKSIPRDDNFYDIIICNEVFEHISEPSDALKEIHRVLKPNGKLFLTVPQCHGIHQEPHNYFNYLSYGLEYLLKKNNFTSYHVIPLGGIYHLLGKVIQNSINLIFQKINIKIRILLYPIEIVIKFVFFIIYVILFHTDKVDGQRKWTINYGCIATK